MCADWELVKPFELLNPVKVMGEGGECICMGEGRRVGELWVMKAPSEAVTLPQTRGWCISSDSVCCRQVQYGRR